ncbi:MAG: selenocysteine-specific translation elongation factor [Anaerolineales bacterium]
MTYIIGTAGHVDHGKSTLIEAITGTHPDRLREEREREMSIVLGFDSFQLPDGKQVSVVDVPGHRDFIENMLSGIGSIDACLLVIAADEGVMPQTREHLDILHLLRVDSGLVALTKVDLVDDPEWLDLVELEVRELLEPTALKDAPIVRVSARKKTGIDELLEALGQVLSEKAPRLDLGKPRLSVDRAFLMSGFGAVVTGTLLDGKLRVGEEVVLLPEGRTGRIRGLQHHGDDVEEIGPGNRVAVNISGIDQKEIQRGDVITLPGSYKTTRRLDVYFEYLPDLEKPILHNTKAKLFLGADETTARIRLLGTQSLEPGESGWLQLEVEEPVLAVRGDRYILRRPSPSETLGGGVVVDPFPLYRYKRFDSKVLERLEALLGGDPRDILLQTLTRERYGAWRDIIQACGLAEETAGTNLQALIQEGLVLEIGKEGPRGKLVILRSSWEATCESLLNNVSAYHAAYPLRSGMPLEELKSQSGLKDDLFKLAVASQVESGKLVQEGPNIHVQGFQIQFSSSQKKDIENLLAAFSANPTQPPSVGDCKAAVGDEIYNALLGMRSLLQISSEVVFRPDDYQAMVDKIREKISKDGSITVAQARDMFGSSRKYMLAFLERLDAEGVTVREGDERRLK